MMLGKTSQISGRLLRWYAKNSRELPWRGNSSNRPDPYCVLVSEAMLQQTQVATVVPYFRRFVGRFPDFRALAEASQQDVLRLWQGLGYYRRARNLQATAKIVLNCFAGQLPSSVEELLGLPGIGRYTAGAIASLAFGVRAPILDGNVIRVLCRLDNISDNPKISAVRERLWRRSEELLPRQRVDEFNSALMDLGATICTPRAPKCPACPLCDQCQARAAGTQEQIPVLVRGKARPLERRWTICIQRGGQLLIQRRPDEGRWGGMWQFTTMAERPNDSPSPADIKAQWGLQTTPLQWVGAVKHDLTHRRYEFEVFICVAKPGQTEGLDGEYRWVDWGELWQYPLPRPHVRIAEMARRIIET